MTAADESHGDSPVAPQKDGHLRRVLIIWALLSVIFIPVVLLLGPVIHPSSATDVASFANLTDDVFTALAVPVGLFVLVFAGYSLIAFRETNPATRVEDLVDGPPLQAKPVQQVAWLAITAGLAIFLVAWGMFGFYTQTTVATTHPLVVNVTGQQWTWTYDYPALGVQSHTLVLPKGRQIRLRITSDDVLHGFEVRALAVAMDANPGEWVDVPVFTPTRTGNFMARCMELCGLYHTYMWTAVRVVPPTDFAAWVTANGGRASAGS